VAGKDAIDVIADRVDKIACRKCGRHLDVSGLPSFSIVECPDCHAKQTVPAQLGQFLLLELLGTGGMGAVYQALDQALGRYVAIKVMKRSLGDDVQFVENFLREARAAAAINHRNVVQIYSCGQEKGQPYIVMELVSGGRLDEIIASGNPVDEVRSLEIAIDVAEGLKAANDIGLIHSDIKPANILFDKEGVAKVADFGLARFLKWKDEAPGEIWGTPYYIAPEKARGQKVDHRSDIYSLGATLYHALGAKPPFDGQTATDVVLARLKNPAIGIRVIRPSLQPETADVVARMLESDPFMRYPTYPSLLADLREALRIAKQESRAHRARAKKSNSTPVLVIAGVIAVSIAILLGGLRWAKHHEDNAVVPVLSTVPEDEAAKAAETQQVAMAEQARKESLRTLIQPFNPVGDQLLVSAISKLNEGKPVEMEAQLQNLYNKSSDRGLARYWISLLQTVPCWVQKRDKDALVYLKEIRDVTFKPVGDQAHPGVMPQVLARYMMGEIDEGPVFLETSKWPTWYADVVDFFVGLDYFHKGNLAHAKTSFATYLTKQGKVPSWPYSFKPVVQEWLNQMAAWETQMQNVGRLLAQGQGAKAREILEKAKVTAIPLLHPLIDQALSQAYLVEKTELAEQQRRERRLHQDQVQQDLDRIDEVRTANLPLVAQKDFRKASAALTKVLGDLKTPEGNRYLSLVRESYDRMDALKKFLMARISEEPFKQSGNELGGEAVGADLNGIRVALGVNGFMLRSWDQISVRLMAQLASFYLNKPSIPEKERADQWLSLAVFCYANGGYKPAANYAETAIKLDSSLADKARRLMPDMAAD
jgi:serine/threonine protein kinase